MNHMIKWSLKVEQTILAANREEKKAITKYIDFFHIFPNFLW